MNSFLSIIPEIGWMCVLISCIVSVFFLPISRVTDSIVFPNLISFLLISAGFCGLVLLHVNDDFSVRNVYETSSLNKPILYKILGIWGNYEGSVFLWAWIANLYCLLMCYFIPSEVGEVKPIAIAIKNVLYVMFGMFLVIVANPFERLGFIPLDGVGLNPMLQDIALGIHPPVLYLGYIGFGVVFSISIACSMVEFHQFYWERYVRYWLFASVSFLTFGIGLGSWWAYHELGWGGFWFWDPVENVALIPWLCGVMAFHICIMARRYGVFHKFGYTMVIGTFCLSILGVLVTRSGIMSSVHAFSVSSDRTICILVIMLMIFLIAGYGIYKITITNNLSKVQLHSNMSFFLIIANIIIFGAMLSVVLTGTLYPVILEFFTGDIISVGAPYYNSMFESLGIVTFLCLGLVFFAKNKMKKVNLVLGSICLFFFSVQYLHIDLMAALIFSGACFVVFSSVKVVFNREISKRNIGMFFSHLGIAVFAIGVILSSALHEEYNGLLKVGDNFKLSEFSIKFLKASFDRERAFESLKVSFDVYLDLGVGSKLLKKIVAERRFYTTERMKHSEISISHFWLSDLYIAIGDVDVDGKSVAVRAYYKPFVNLIWVGYILCGIGIASILLQCVFKKFRTEECAI